MTEYPVTAETVAVGDEGPTVVVEDLTRPDFVKYAGASGDFSRIHYDEPYAREAGYPSVFGQGMLTAGVASTLVTDWFGIAHVQRFKTRFSAQVWPGDTVRVTGEVTEVDRDDDTVVVDVTFEAVTQDGSTVLTGEATANLPR
ncbi:MaoC/PaaZ C-terminal domain-containing protein [Halorarius litoreus]|uniref:MaoC/PaaZ C-terminal domain-containing protein n=1 Tax=Halorarius litoreus TaxID=2962676 RepID=UPI0020CF2691|nr:MaoC/PaaZ C-terminal domain-containing protein [Halorarius litoreus]